uniref:Uncharacterized protein n=1 Tax=Vitrella brassicaformis TaxID=1169539 RepID=A0A7S1JIL5_9ALVE
MRDGSEGAVSAARPRACLALFPLPWVFPCIHVYILLTFIRRVCLWLKLGLAEWQEHFLSLSRCCVAHAAVLFFVADVIWLLCSFSSVRWRCFCHLSMPSFWSSPTLMGERVPLM